LTAAKPSVEKRRIDVERHPVSRENNGLHNLKAPNYVSSDIHFGHGNDFVIFDYQGCCAQMISGTVSKVAHPR
ncbi:MAG: hypothetical protein KJ731_15585, partial [Alphaproteobacteria bacterium]|nr:hypothetical protein [Alphaproteobacteria bacterium]MBU1829873.1 hypothetical protein [Alphaproteobacteria bacterium]